jgi:polysaccharide biosynthesis/export protein
MGNRIRGHVFINTSFKLKVWLLGLVLLTLNSCVIQRDVEYLQTKNRTNTVYIESEIADYRLRPYDELFIQISSLDDQTMF